MLGAEVLLINILKRAKELARKGTQLYASPALSHFLYNNITLEDFQSSSLHLEKFCMLDDVDILASVKEWCRHSDKILSRLCCMMQYRKLYKVILTSDPIDGLAEEKRKAAAEAFHATDEEMDYFVSTGVATKDTYNINDERINIAMKNGSVKDISEIDNPVVTQALARPVHKNYICYINPVNELF